MPFQSVKRTNDHLM